MKKGKEKTPDLTPVMAQYMEAKAQNPEAILFFRMGDFYEMFYEDAKLTARVLGIALTSRNKGEGAVPMAGVPVRSAHTYIFRLLKEGYRVAVCEQVQDPREAKGLVERKVVRIITPGTLTEEEALDSKAPNYVAALAPGRERVGLAWLDLSTGRFLVHEVPRKALADELSRIEPAEVLFPEAPPGEEGGEEGRALETLLGNLEAARTPWRAWAFTPESGFQTLTSFFKVAGLGGFGLEENPLAVGAAGALVDYLQETQKTALPHITRVEPFLEAGIMRMDRATRASLELTRTMREGSTKGSLLSVVDQTLTPMGGRLLREWILSPLTDPARILERQEGVAFFVERGRERRELRELFKGMADLERIGAKVSTGRANARDLVSLAGALKRLPPLKEALGTPYADILARTLEEMDTLEDLVDRITNCLVDDPPLQLKEGGLIREGFDAELDELRAIGREGKDWMARFQAEEIERTGIQNLRVGFNKVFGYYIEVSRSNAGAVPASYIRKQTLKNAERYITPELKEYETRVLKSEEMAREMEYNMFLALREEVARAVPRLLATARAVALLDVLSSFAELARTRGYTRPRVDASRVLTIRGGRHPVLETTLPGDAFVPNDTDLAPPARRISLITGPNMAGKSTYIRQVALIVLLAQTGSFVPAEEAHIGVVDRIFTRVGASDDIAAGNSTFMVEMLETANILNNATESSLVILDEVGRGTSTHDGLALAWAICEDLHDRIGCRALFATHFHQLTGLAENLPGLGNHHVAVREWGDQVVFLHRILEGGTDKSYGIHVARLAGVPDRVIRRAREILEDLEVGAERVRKAVETPREGPRQALLFDLPPDPVVEKLKKLDLERMSPLDALLALKELQEEAGGRRKVRGGRRGGNRGRKERPGEGERGRTLFES